MPSTRKTQSCQQFQRIRRRLAPRIHPGPAHKIFTANRFRTSNLTGSTYMVEHTLDGNTEELKEYSLGAEVLGRGEASRFRNAK